MAAFDDFFSTNEISVTDNTEPTPPFLSGVSGTTHKRSRTSTINTTTVAYFGRSTVCSFVVDGVLFFDRCVHRCNLGGSVRQ